MKNFILFLLAAAGFFRIHDTGSFAGHRYNLFHQARISDSVVGVFGGRTPCNNILRDLNNISADGCNRLKVQLTLYQDPNTLTPTRFRLRTIYVGKDDNIYITTGKWMVSKGGKTNPDAVVYQLNPDNSEAAVYFLKADDNLLFLLDKEKNLLVGNKDLSYTLNRSK